MKSIKISAVREIGRILDYVHDRSFELSDVKYDSSTGILSIPLTVIIELVIDHKVFFLFHTWNNPIVKADLVVRNVTAYEIIDNAEIGVGIINTITLKDHVIRINSSVPVRIEAEISEFCIELKLSNTTVGKVSRFSFRSPRKTQ